MPDTATPGPAGAPGTPGLVALPLPFSPRSAGVARARLVAWLNDQAQPESVIDDSRLVVSELVGNAVRHARPLADNTLVVGWHPGGAHHTLDLFVTDGGAPTRPRVLDAEPGDLAGRGLCIVDEVAERWWYDAQDAPEPRGTVHVLLTLA